MGENVQQPPAWPDHLQLEQRLREQLNEGCRLARQLDERLRSIPEGRLMEMRWAATPVQQGEEAEAPGSRSGSLAMAAAEVVGAFNEAVKLLLLQDNMNNMSRPGMNVNVRGADLSPTFSAATSPRQARGSSSPSCVPAAQGRKSTKQPAGSEAVPLPLASSGCLPTPPNLATAQASKQGEQQQCVMMSSPPGLMIQSPLLSATTSEMSEGSPAAEAAIPHASADDAATTSANPDAVKGVPSRKRKLLPKVTVRMLASSLESADSNTPPDDGHTWRKYGQKVIHGALHPRGYYRCTRKTDLGCPAIKQVQRCDEEEMVFDVVYKGYHTCRPVVHWPLAVPEGLCNLLNISTSRGTTSPQVLSGLGVSTVAASLVLTGPTPVSSQRTSTSSAASSLGGGSANMQAVNQLANTGLVDTATLQVQSHLQFVGANQCNAPGYAQGQSRVFDPLENWSTHSEQCNKRPFMKASHDSAAPHRRQQLIPSISERQEFLPANEGQQQQLQFPMSETQQLISQLYGSVIGSTPASSGTTLQMNVISSHEQIIDATIMSSSPSPSIGIDVQSSIHNFGTTRSTPTFDDDDMDNDSLLSDYFKSLN